MGWNRQLVNRRIDISLHNLASTTWGVFAPIIFNRIVATSEGLTFGLPGSLKNVVVFSEALETPWNNRILKWKRWKFSVVLPEIPGKIDLGTIWEMSFTKTTASQGGESAFLLDLKLMVESLILFFFQPLLTPSSLRFPVEGCINRPAPMVGGMESIYTQILVTIIFQLYQELTCLRALKNMLLIEVLGRKHIFWQILYSSSFPRPFANRDIDAVFQCCRSFWPSTTGWKRELAAFKSSMLVMAFFFKILGCDFFKKSRLSDLNWWVSVTKKSRYSSIYTRLITYDKNILYTNYPGKRPQTVWK